MDRGEGQQWDKAPGNLFSTPREMTIEPGSNPAVTIIILLDKVIPPIKEPETTKYIKHERIQSDRLTKFWGRPMHLGAHVLLPEGFDSIRRHVTHSSSSTATFPRLSAVFGNSPPIQTSSPILASGSIWPAITASCRSTPISSTRNGPAPIIHA